MMRLFYHTDPVTCERVYRWYSVVKWVAVKPTAIPAACVKGAIVGLPLFVAAAAPVHHEAYGPPIPAGFLSPVPYGAGAAPFIGGIPYNSYIPYGGDNFGGSPIGDFGGAGGFSSGGLGSSGSPGGFIPVRDIPNSPIIPVTPIIPVVPPVIIVGDVPPPNTIVPPIVIPPTDNLPPIEILPPPVVVTPPTGTPPITDVSEPSSIFILASAAFLLFVFKRKRTVF